MKIRCSRLLPLSLGIFLALTIPEHARAVQVHGGAEGLVSHQIGHILFIVGMAYLLFRLYRTQVTGPGWFEFKGFLWLIIVWNFITFSGHWMHELMGQDKFVNAGGHIVAFKATSLFDAFFYITRLDHLLLVPSFILLLLALRKWEGAQK